MSLLLVAFGASMTGGPRFLRHCEARHHVGPKQSKTISMTTLLNKQMGGWVYIMCSVNRSTLYVGVTSNLPSRVYEHKNKVYPKSFTSRYNCIHLVYYEFYETITEAIAEEKRIKGGSRKKKEALINSMNPGWKDLYDEIKLL